MSVSVCVYIYIHIYIYIYIYIYICVCVRVCMCQKNMRLFFKLFVDLVVYLSISKYIHMYICIYVHMYTCKYQCMYVHVCILYIYIYATPPKTYIFCIRYVLGCLVFLLIFSPIATLHQESSLCACTWTHLAHICSCSIAHVKKLTT